MGKITQLNIAELRHRIAIQSITEVSDGQGGKTESWSTVATVWARIEPVSSRERLYSDKLEYQRTHKIAIRYRSDITNDMRILFNGRYFQIKAVYSPDEREAYTFIDAEENQGT